MPGFNESFTTVILVFRFFAVPLYNKSITLMDSILLIFLCLFLGLGLQSVAFSPKKGHLGLNQFVIYVAFPTLAIYDSSKIIISTNLLYTLGFAWLCFPLFVLFFYFIFKTF